MRRWDLFLLVGVVLLVVAAGALDWRLGCAVAGSALVAVWYWLGNPEEG